MMNLGLLRRVDESGGTHGDGTGGRREEGPEGEARREWSEQLDGTGDLRLRDALRPVHSTTRKKERESGMEFVYE